MGDKIKISDSFSTNVSGRAAVIFGGATALICGIFGAVAAAPILVPGMAICAWLGAKSGAAERLTEVTPELESLTSDAERQILSGEKTHVRITLTVEEPQNFLMNNEYTITRDVTRNRR